MTTKNQTLKKENTDILTAEELEKMYLQNSFGSYSLEKIFNDSKYNYNALKSAPFFGEETLGIYLKIYEKLGEMSYTPALYELGLLYYNGEWWLEQNLEKSIKYHKKAAELGNADAMFELYALYSTGQGVKQNNKVALEWCKKAAEKDHYRACYNMGAFYATGNGVPEDADVSLKWYERASKAGNGKASATLGVMHKLGQGAPQDDKKAEDYFKLSEEQLFDVEEFLAPFGIDRNEKKPIKPLKKHKGESGKAEPTLEEYKIFIERLRRAKKPEDIRKFYDEFYETRKSTSTIALIKTYEDGKLVEKWIPLIHDRISEMIGTEAGDLLTMIAEELFKG